MSKHVEARKVFLSLTLFTVVASGFTTVATIRQQNDATKKQQPGDEHAEFKAQFPVAEYSAPDPADPNQRAKRRAKSKKYDKSLMTLSGRDDVVVSWLHWSEGLAALPVAKSHAVVIGTVTAAEAYVSDDRTGVYSEFTVQIEEVLKNVSSVSLAPGTTVSVERPGGRVKFTSGEVALMYTAAQGMPRVGRRYVLFLSHDFPPYGRRYEDLYVLTGYELRAGRVHPLDSPHGHPINAQKGKAEAAFLEELRAVVANP